MMCENDARLDGYLLDGRTLASTENLRTKNEPRVHFRVSTRPHLSYKHVVVVVVVVVVSSLFHIKKNTCKHEENHRQPSVLYAGSTP